MKKSYIVIIVLVVIAIALYSFFKGNYNTMVTKSEAVSSQWSNVENQYQRRVDLIPNLVNTVKGYAEHEQSTLTAVVEARAQATQAQINFNELDEASLQRFNQAQGQLSSALSRLLVVAERYPDLKANQNFLELQAQLEGTENRIAVERRKFNEVVQDYNSYIRQFPRNIIAGMFGFIAKPYFQAIEGAQTAPQVNF
ncbi:MAG: LemA family protein [Odoribacter sp.]|nr:LemA family protein [Odoribacter sp.]